MLAINRLLYLAALVLAQYHCGRCVGAPLSAGRERGFHEHVPQDAISFAQPRARHSHAYDEAFIPMSPALRPLRKHHKNQLSPLAQVRTNPRLPIHRLQKTAGSLLMLAKVGREAPAGRKS